VLGHRLSSPHFQGSAYISYGFHIGQDTHALIALNAQNVGSYPSSFPRVPGNPNATLATFGYTDDYSNVNLSLGLKRRDWSAQLYVENLLDDHSITYIHPEAFLFSRFGTMRPRTVGIRIGYGI
jgi:hypothetical protein